MVNKMILDEVYQSKIEYVCDLIQTDSWMYSEYQEYILNNCGGDRVVLDDDLPDVAAEGYLLEAFVESIMPMIESGELTLPTKDLNND